MAKAIAINLREYALRPAVESARNFSAKIADLMYGTPKRVNITTGIAFGMIMLGYMMGETAMLATLAVCPA